MILKVVVTGKKRLKRDLPDDYLDAWDLFMDKFHGELIEVKTFSTNCAEAINDSLDEWNAICETVAPGVKIEKIAFWIGEGQGSTARLATPIDIFRHRIINHIKDNNETI